MEARLLARARPWVRGAREKERARERARGCVLAPRRGTHLTAPRAELSSPAARPISLLPAPREGRPGRAWIWAGRADFAGFVAAALRFLLVRGNVVRIGRCGYLGLAVFGRDPGIMWKMHASAPLESRTWGFLSSRLGRVFGISKESFISPSWRRISCSNLTRAEFFPLL